MVGAPLTQAHEVTQLAVIVSDRLSGLKVPQGRARYLPR